MSSCTAAHALVSRPAGGAPTLNACSPSGARRAAPLRRGRVVCVHAANAAWHSAAAGAASAVATARGIGEDCGSIETVIGTNGTDHRTAQTAAEEPRTDGALSSS